MNLIGEKFGRLTVLEVLNKDKWGKYKIKAQCSCGKKTIAAYSNIKFGNTRSCGCLAIKSKIKHGNCTRAYKSPEYKSYQNMKARCLLKSHKHFKHYGGRGITISKEWLDEEKGFKTFLNDMGKREKGFSIERKKVNDNYCKENCSWSNTKEQALNKRTEGNKTSKYRGVYWNKDINKWQSTIGLNRKTKYLGVFSIEKEAAEAFLEAYSTYYRKWPPEYSNIPLCYNSPLTSPTDLLF